MRIAGDRQKAGAKLGNRSVMALRRRPNRTSSVRANALAGGRARHVAAAFSQRASAPAGVLDGARGARIGRVKVRGFLFARRGASSSNRWDFSTTR
ncbi:hypothetical protein HF313_29365 [Massilia atriviolacea]|uniref:Uncharacterized protein n=1 Tax=Massilia atriviolacea TaxID=2495579 RepID=A0A430HC97_9BURK|nr:hypothetical protein [Massilia atriviolacea]RSZ55137.1 hypothetical protein EJB06_30980 [Massilia atriviolacea]